MTTDSATLPPAPPQLSPDGQWWWDGARWGPSNANTAFAQEHALVASNASAGTSAQGTDGHSTKPKGSVAIGGVVFPAWIIVFVLLAVIVALGAFGRAEINSSHAANHNSTCAYDTMEYNLVPSVSRDASAASAEWAAQLAADGCN